MIRNIPSIIVNGEKIDIVPNNVSYDPTKNCDTCKHWDLLLECENEEGKLDFDLHPCPMNNKFKYAHGKLSILSGSPYNLKLILSDDPENINDCEAWETK